MKGEIPYWLLLLIVVAALLPNFLLASRVDADEFVKSGTGVATVGAIVAIWKAWLRARMRS